MVKMLRVDNRRNDQMRTLHIEYNPFAHADGSVLLSIGNTKVLCAVTLVNQVPSFMRNKKEWWLTASYNMLPAATLVRSERDTCGKRNDRAIEIARLIGRSLRSVVNRTNKLTEKTIHVDCDVMQADGGTRAASITAAYAALRIAEQRWLQAGDITEPILSHSIAAISVGLVHNELYLDLNAAEDTACDADFNFVMTNHGTLVELQGCAERAPMAWSVFGDMYALAQKGVHEQIAYIESTLPSLSNAVNTIEHHHTV